MLHDTDGEGAVRVAEAVREVLSRSSPAPGNGVERVTASTGIAFFPRHGAVLDEVVNVADTAMYKAKALGRDRIVLARAGDQAPPPAPRSPRPSAPPGSPGPERIGRTFHAPPGPASPGPWRRCRRPRKNGGLAPARSPPRCRPAPAPPRAPRRAPPRALPRLDGPAHPVGEARHEEGLALPCRRDGDGGVVGPGSGAEHGRVADAAGHLAEATARGGSGRQVALPVEGDGSHGAAW